MKLFIRKNTSELLNKLKVIGYDICPCAMFRNSSWLTVNDGVVHGVGYDDHGIESVEKRLQFFLEDNAEHGYPYYDCGEDEELFLETAKKEIK